MQNKSTPKQQVNCRFLRGWTLIDSVWKRTVSMGVEKEPEQGAVLICPEPAVLGKYFLFLSVFK
jgi:hypothetical protein